MPNVLVYVEESSWGKQLSTAARGIGTAVLYTPSKEVVGELTGYYERLYYSTLQHFDPMVVSKAIQEVLSKESPNAVLFPCTNKGRMIAGLLAGSTGYDIVTDTVSLKSSADRFEAIKLTFGGNASATLKVNKPIIACIVSGSYKESEPSDSKGEVIEVSTGEYLLSVEFSPRKLEGVDPSKADIVVGAGRGVKKKEDLEMIKKLADILGGAWSVTRPLAADYGWADTWIGISGLVINPKLYVAIGVSGQPHHTMGVRGARIIVSINNDESAPIFEESDYGVVGDLYTVVPILIGKLKEKK
ncbi:MAG: electron transfer flavoprotein subunit alpha/FixB family protein [Desulfurococcales archaeon]|nr:electron transfer flavoprotein subunit alpha/FixB family protein [Desulfurococcales archaeon]